MQKVCDIADTVGGNIAADCRISAEETGVQPKIRGTFDIGNGIVIFWQSRFLYRINSEKTEIRFLYF